jgi:hypothetical protein
MARRVAESIEVRVAGERSDAPMSFLWRNRLYVVREVLDHWRERQDWWTASAARAVHGDVVGSGTTSSTTVSSGMARGSTNGGVNNGGVSDDVESTGGGVRLAVNVEQEVWRVEASPGRAFGTGVYDLAREPTTGSSVDRSKSAAGAPKGRWQLVRVVD